MPKVMLNIILLTATIEPPKDAKDLARKDVSLRLQDYSEAFEFYLDKIRSGEIDSLVFCDNSGFDLSSLQAMAQEAAFVDRVEIISFFGLDYPPAYGRGYGEFKLVDFAMKNSAIISVAPSNARIWKITGRYKLINIRKILRKANVTADFYCNCRDIPSRWLDLYVLAWNKHGYNEIVSGTYEKLNESEPRSNAEKEFRNLIDKGTFQSKIVRRFNVIPILNGLRGLDNAQYSGMKWKYITRSIINRLFPCLWI